MLVHPYFLYDLQRVKEFTAGLATAPTSRTPAFRDDRPTCQRFPDCRYLEGQWFDGGVSLNHSCSIPMCFFRQSSWPIGWVDTPTRILSNPAALVVSLEERR